MGSLYFPAMPGGQIVGIVSHQTFCLLLSIVGALLLCWGVFKITHRKAAADPDKPRPRRSPAPPEPPVANAAPLSDYLRKKR